jgi:hypothetical protein
VYSLQVSRIVLWWLVTWAVLKLDISDFAAGIWMGDFLSWFSFEPKTFIDVRIAKVKIKDSFIVVIFQYYMGKPCHQASTFF